MPDNNGRRLGKGLLVVGALVILAAVWLINEVPHWKLEHAVRTKLSEGVPKIASVQDARIDAIERSRASLAPNRMPTLELYFSVSPKNLEQVLPALLKDHIPAIKSAKLIMGHQELIIDVAFEHFEQRYKARIRGNAIVHTTVAVANGKLKLISHVSDLEIKSVSIGRLGNVSIIAAAFNADVSELKRQIDAQLDQPPDPIPLSIVQTVQPKDVLSDAGFMNVSGPDITLAAAVGTSAILIDDDGLHVVANLIELTPSRTKRVIEELKTIAEQMKTARGQLSSEQIAMLSKCSSKPVIDSAEEAEEYNGFLKACSALKDSGDVELAIAKKSGMSAADVEHEFTMLVGEFQKSAKIIASLDELGWGKTDIAVSKSFVSSTLNDFANDPHYKGTYRPTDTSFANRQEVTTDKAPDLKCDDIQCNPDYGKCVPTWSCEGRGCPGGCGLFDVGCHAWKPICEALKAAEQTGCMADKVRFQTQCNATTALDKATCETKKAGCKTNQEWLNTWSEKQIGLVESSGLVQALTVNFEVNSFNTSALLDQVTIGAVFSASGEINGNAKFTPRDLGNLACVGQWNAGLHAGITSNTSSYSITSKLVRVERQGEDLVLTYTSDPLPIDIKFHPSPFQALLDNNPKLYIQCAGGVIGRLSGTGFKEDYPYTIPSKETKLHFAKNTTIILGTTLDLYPEWGGTSKVIRFLPHSPRWKL
ncbi:hypothetical protein [Tunturiibacter psychrotolerans]|uniref:hypothetical protein n=1 Tax=Tunturiibacter psychrotolerans TaxID=3069686 RepID=UPI003D1F49BD